MRRRVQIAIAAVVLALLGGGGWAFRSHGKQDTASTLRAAPVKRTDLVATISATGTVEPEEVVDVGAQVAGQITALGRDRNGKQIDYGSAVEEGTVLALIDDSLYAADVASAKAAQQQAQANQISAEANLLQLKAKLVQAQQDWDRAQKLGPSEALAQSVYDSYKAAYEIAKANVAVGLAALEQAKASIAQAQASMARTQRNLSYCTITSPVQGVIIDRRVNIGQTVVSSLNAPSLFLIAKDLKRIQVWVSVNEADIGHIQAGQPVSFTVDAFPGRVFHGTVDKLRLNATMTQNVVSYTVEVNTDNSDGKLLPYLTANAQFEAGRHTNVLAVANAALRWLPRPNQIAPEFREKTQGSDGSPRRGGSSRGTPTEGANVQRGTVWLRQGEFVRPARVAVGLTDGSFTEVESKDLAEDMVVVLGEQSPQMAAAPGGASPFTPQLGAGRRNASQGGGSEGGGERPGDGLRR